MLGLFLASAGVPSALAAGAGGSPGSVGSGTHPAPAQTPSPAEDAAASAGRAWQEVVNDMLAATGGKAVLEKKASLYEKVSIALTTLKMEGTVESWATRDNKALRVTELTGVPTTREGTDGKVFWSQDPVNGLRVLSGQEKEQARIETAWMAELRLAKLFQKIESVREKGAHGEALECLRLTPKGATTPLLTNCYDEKTHLQVSQRGTHASPQGDVPFSSELSDHRDVGGVKLPFLVKTTIGPISFTARIEEAKWDVPLKGVAFGVPKAGAAAKEKPAAKDEAAAPKAAP